MNEDNKPADGPATDAPAGPSYATAADALPQQEPVTTAVPRRSQHVDSGLSRSYDLEVVPNSFAPATASGEAVPHVRGPGQNPVDPVAAGLDTHNVLRAADVAAAMTLTGRDVSGREPATYVEKTGGAPLVPDADIAPTSLA